MLFNSLHFVVFFTVVYAIYRLLKHRAQNILLLLASYVFYAAWDWRFLGLILFSTLIDYVCGLQVAGKKYGRVFLWISLTTNLALLAIFKYFHFFEESLLQLLAMANIQADPFPWKIILPVGISFYTFQTMSYTIDVYRGRLGPTRNFLDFALFVAFFPQLVAGPIERAVDLLPQIIQPRRVTMDDIGVGLWLLLLGYFQKVFVADNLAPLADAVFSRQDRPNGFLVLLGLYAFAFQIYGDFAGYSNIARGVARLMGFQLMVNFSAPYFSQGPAEFWRRWHISLSTWLRDYLYIPLGGNRGTPWRVYRNLMITMLLGGLWHGASWNFIVWGAYQGGILVLFRGISGGWEARPKVHPVLMAVRILLMFQVICIGWLLFRAESLSQIGEFLAGLFWNLRWESGIGLGGFATLAKCTALLLLLDFSVWRSGIDLAFLQWPAPVRVALGFAMLWAVLIYGNFGHHEFIYFQF